MAKKLSKLQLAQQKAEAAAKKTNQKINELGIHTNDLYTALVKIQSSFDPIRNVPEENRLTYEKLKAIRVKWKQQAENIGTSRGGSQNNKRKQPGRKLC